MHPVSSPAPGHTPPRTVAIIPARYESSRFPGKPLADLDGRPMIEHVYRRVSETPGLEAVLVATDDERIREAVERFGGRAVMTSATHQSGTDRLAEVAESLDCDVVINVQGDEPLVDPAMLTSALLPFAADPDEQMTTLCRRPEGREEFESLNAVKVVVDRRGRALYFSRSPVPHARGLAGGFDPAVSFIHIGLYAYRRDVLLALARLPSTPLERAESLEQLRALEHGYRITVVPTDRTSIGVDTPEDLERVRRILAGAAA